MPTPNDVLWFLITMIVLITFVYFIFFHLIPIHNEKIKAKQASKEKEERDSVFFEAPTGFLHNRYESFEDTPMMEKVS